MTWSISLFFFSLILVLMLMAVSTLQVNEFEKKTNTFVDLLKKRYDLEKLRKAYLDKQKQIDAQKRTL